MVRKEVRPQCCDPMQTTPETFTTPPPKQAVYWQRAVLWQSVGFLIIIVLTWCNAIFDLNRYFFGLDRFEDEFNQTAIATGVIFLLWIFSSYKVYRVVSRLTYLENFLHVCAWCRKIEHESQWLSLEDHFTRRTGGQTSHGICPECSKKFLATPGAAPHS